MTPQAMAFTRPAVRLDKWRMKKNGSAPNPVQRAVTHERKRTVYQGMSRPRRAWRWLGARGERDASQPSCKGLRALMGVRSHLPLSGAVWDAVSGLDGVGDAAAAAASSVTSRMQRSSPSRAFLATASFMSSKATTRLFGRRPSPASLELRAHKAATRHVPRTAIEMGATRALPASPAHLRSLLSKRSRRRHAEALSAVRQLPDFRATTLHRHAAH